MTSKLSRGEATFIRQGIEQNVRNDGRTRTDYRYFNVQTGVVVTARGSARVRLGGSCVLAAVSIELFTPEASAPNAGKLTCSVDCTANASDEFEGKGAEVKNAALTSDLERLLIESKCVDLSKLVVVKGTACWNVSVDALVMDSGGNILDTICLAARAALGNTVIPRMEVTYNEEGVAEIGDVDDDPTAGDPFPVESVPICVSIAKIGSCFVVDPSEDEEQCMAALISVAVTSTGDIGGVHKRGPGGLAPPALAVIIKSAKEVGVNLHKQLASSVPAVKPRAPTTKASQKEAAAAASRAANRADKQQKKKAAATAAATEKKSNDSDDDTGVANVDDNED